MRSHAFRLAASATFLFVACGETLSPSPDEQPPDRPDADGAAAADADTDADACMTTPCGVLSVVDVAPRAIAASAAGLAWLVDDTVHALPVDAAAPHEVASVDTNTVATGYLVLDGVLAFFPQPSGPRSCAITSRCTPPGAPLYGLANTGPIAVSGGALFAADRAKDRALATCAATGRCQDDPDVVAWLPGTARFAVATSAYVVVAFSDGAVRSYLQSARVPRSDAGADAAADGGGVAGSTGVLLATVADLRGLAASSSFVYWTDGAARVVVRRRPDGTSPVETVVKTRTSPPSALAVDGNVIYWTEPDEDAVYRCTAPTCSDVGLVAKVRQPGELAVGDRLYVVGGADRKIYAAPR